MLMLVVLTLAAAEKKNDPSVSVDSVTVNGEQQAGEAPTARASVAPVSTSTGQAWSVVTSRTIGKNANALQGSVGYPGASFSLLRGVLDNLDVGGRITVNYGVEGQLRQVQTGVKLQALGKLRFFDNGKVNLGMQLAPGLLIYFPNTRLVTNPQVGITLPVLFNLGIAVSSAVAVGVTVDIPLWIRFSPDSGLAVPVLMGAGLEYFLTSTLAIWFDVRMGPTIWSNHDATEFTLDGKVGIAWRF